MKTLRTRSAPVLLFALAMSLALPAAADEAFDANLAIARQNLATPAGAAYDRALGDAMRAAPGVSEAMTACLEKHPGDHSVQGFFHITSPGGYKVVLAPADPFSACLVAALEGWSLPAPPSLPWFNHFTLVTKAAGADPTP
jgi:hypothetical protein